MEESLAEAMTAHLSEPFPDAIEKGRDYGEVDPALVDAEIYGWATNADSLTESDRSELADAAERLERSLPTFPIEDRPYFERLVRIARLTLAD